MDIINDVIEELEAIKQDFIYQMNKKTIDVAIKALEAQKRLLEYKDYSICEWWEDYDWDKNDISEYIYVASVNDFLIDEVKCNEC